VPDPLGTVGGVRRLVSTEVGLVAAVAVSLLVGYVGLAVCVSGHDRLAGVVVLLVGRWGVGAAPVVHDQEHRVRGELTHALWGRYDRRKPRWWPVRWPRA
jgi:hypothetical protein